MSLHFNLSDNFRFAQKITTNSGISDKCGNKFEDKKSST